MAAKTAYRVIAILHARAEKDTAVMIQLKIQSLS